MWGALGTQPGKWLAGRADSINSCCATLPDPSRRVAVVELLFCQPLEMRRRVTGAKAGEGSLSRGYCLLEMEALL